MKECVTRADQFQEQGYLLLENFASADECAALMDRAWEIVDQWIPQAQHNVFSTTNRQQDRDGGFLESADKVACFFEEEAFGPDGKLIRDGRTCVNKIGHALHDLDPVFADFSRSERMAKLAKEVGMVDPLLIQSMVIFKQPKIGGKVVPHQDGSFLRTDPESVIGFWLALEDATVENGCLWVLPGQHNEPLRSYFGLDGEGGANLSFVDERPFDMEDKVPVEVKAGTLVLLHGRLPHWSEANRSSKSRLAFTLHCVNGNCHYHEKNWIQRDLSFPFKGF